MSKNKKCPLNSVLTPLEKLVMRRSSGVYERARLRREDSRKERSTKKEKD